MYLELIAQAVNSYQFPTISSDASKHEVKLLEIWKKMQVIN